MIELHAEVLARHPDLPWSSIKGMRNRIAHGYFELDMATVWETERRSLPELIGRLPAVIDAERGDSGG